MKTPVAAAFTLALAALFAVPAMANEEAAPAAKVDVAKGQEISTNVCAACHTNDGSRGSPANPILQGQHPEYIVKQLTEFKAGKRKNAIMSGMAAPLAEDDMKHIAAFYGKLTAKPGAGTAIDSENALALMRWQPVQWQAIESSGGWLILKRTCPQRQPPSHGRFQSDMFASFS